ncbi:MAG: AbrB/MazE/SpoVT family DNA-binding domain-containing protein [Candidatus Schekmanbacteria bacterium]|nr:AbrB/MazE/SpoVT family DNA-binding domain-containing protein [Candidatus Schekmanbacteria bacterium]
MLVKKTSKNQLTLPKEIVKSFPDTDYFDISVRDRKIVLVPVRITSENTALEGIREKLAKLSITVSEVPKAVRWARKNKSRHI